MTLSISSSSRLWALVSVSVPLAVLGVFFWWMIRIGEPLPASHNPVVANIEEALDPGELGLVVLGSSVTMAGIDAESLAENLIPGRAVNLAHRGGQPAHWLATVRHRLDSDTRSPRVILLYVPLHTLAHGELNAEADRLLLVDLLRHSDPDLLERGLGTTAVGGVQERLSMGRDRTRQRVLDVIGRTPARWIWGVDAVEMATLAQRQTPRDPAGRGMATPGVPTAGREQVIEPHRLSFEASFMPDLVEETKRLGARLVIVVPATSVENRRGPACQYNEREGAIVQGLLRLGVDVVDVSDAPIPSDAFETRQHLTTVGIEMLEPILRDSLVLLDFESTNLDTPGRHLGCPSTGQ